MLNENNQNIYRIKTIALALKNLNANIVFVGGSIAELYWQKENIIKPRPTIDVDAFIKVTSHHEFHQIEEELRKLGFKNDVKNGVICRWHLEGIIFDLMPTDPKIFGFSNKWYELGLSSAQTIQIGKDIKIKILSFPFYLATKIEAAKNRGAPLYSSKDIEDIILILVSRLDLSVDLKTMNKIIVENLKPIIIGWLRENEFEMAIEYTLPNQIIENEKQKIINFFTQITIQ